MTPSEQATLQSQLDRVLAEIARLEWKIELEAMVQQWLGKDDSTTGSRGQTPNEESMSASRTKCARLNLKLRELRSESVRLTALLPVRFPRATAIRLVRKPD